MELDIYYDEQNNILLKKKRRAVFFVNQAKKLLWYRANRYEVNAAGCLTEDGLQNDPMLTTYCLLILRKGAAKCGQFITLHIQDYF